MNDLLEEIRKTDKDALVKWAILLIYMAAIIFAEIMFIQIMKDVFPDGITRWFAVIGAVMNGATACLMPFAKDRYFAPGKMHTIGLVLWAADVVVMILNVLLAFEVQQGIRTGGMFSWWYDFSPASPLMAVVTWGILMVLSPEHELHQKEILRKNKLADVYADAEFDYIDDGGVNDILEAGARANMKDLAERIAKRKIRISKPKPLELPAPSKTPEKSIVGGNGRVNEEADPTPRQ